MTMKTDQNIEGQVIGTARVKDDVERYVGKGDKKHGLIFTPTMAEYAGKSIYLQKSRFGKDVFFYSGYYWAEEWLEDVKIFQDKFIQYEEE